VTSQVGYATPSEGAGLGSTGKTSASHTRARTDGYKGPMNDDTPGHKGPMNG